tara:strand:- start:1904 stop:2053 length:150 start_codon:yes stop_codon:yes gene_type:complete
MRKLFDCDVGHFDHTMGLGVAIVTAALGAELIEKHFTIRSADNGVDFAF